MCHGKINLNQLFTFIEINGNCFVQNILDYSKYIVQLDKLICYKIWKQ